MAAETKKDNIVKVNNNMDAIEKIVYKTEQAIKKIESNNSYSKEIKESIKDRYIKVLEKMRNNIINNVIDATKVAKIDSYLNVIERAVCEIEEIIKKMESKDSYSKETKALIKDRYIELLEGILKKIDKEYGME